MAQHTVASLATRVADLEAALARFEQMHNAIVAQPQQPRRSIHVMSTFSTDKACWELARSVAKERATGNTRFTYRIEANERGGLNVVAHAKAH